MPFYSDHIANMYYSGTPSYSSAPYSYSSSSVSPLGSSYSASYLNPGGSYGNHSSLGGYSRPLNSRWATGTGRNYSPILSTITERGTKNPIRINSPRRIPLSKRSYGTAPYIPRPLNINTADIDVSRDRYRPKHDIAQSTVVEKTASSSDNISNDGPFMPRVDGKPQTGIDSSPGQQRSTIKRGRTVVRLHTIKRKERDSPRKPSEDPKQEQSAETDKVPLSDSSQDACDESTEPIGWREKLADDLTYKDKREKKTLGAKLVEKFILKDTKDDELVKELPRPEKAISLPASPLPDNLSGVQDRRCSVELLAEQANVLDALIRRENLSTASLDLSKVGLSNDNKGAVSILSESIKRKKSNKQEYGLKTTKSDYSLHESLKQNRGNKDPKHFSKRRSLKKSSSGGSICRLDSITEFPREPIEINLPAIEENKEILKFETKYTKPKLKAKITTSVEVDVSPPKSPLKFKVENIIVEEKLRSPKIIYSSTLDDVDTFEFKAPFKKEPAGNKSQKRMRSSTKNKTASLNPESPTAMLTAESPEPEDGNFWDKIGKRETVYLVKRKQTLEEEREKSRRAVFWFPEGDEETCFNENAVTEEIKMNDISLHKKDEEDIKTKDISTNMKEEEEMKTKDISTDKKGEGESKLKDLTIVKNIEENIETKDVNIDKKYKGEIQPKNMSTEKKGEGEIELKDTDKKEEIKPIALIAVKKDEVIVSIPEIISADQVQCITNIDSSSNKKDISVVQFSEPKVINDIQIENELTDSMKINHDIKDTTNHEITSNLEETNKDINTQISQLACNTSEVTNDKDTIQSPLLSIKNDAKSKEPVGDNVKNKTFDKEDLLKQVENNAKVEVENNAKVEVQNKNNSKSKLKKDQVVKKSLKKDKSEKNNPTKKVSDKSGDQTPISETVKSEETENQCNCAKVNKSKSIEKQSIQDDELMKENDSQKTESDIVKVVNQVSNEIKEINLRVVESKKHIPKENDNNTLACKVDTANKSGEVNKSELEVNKSGPSKDVLKPPAPTRKPVKDEPALRPLIATPRPLQKKVPQIIHSSSSSDTSSEEESSDDDDADESDTSEDTTEFFECENPDGRTSTGSNDSGFDSSAPTSPAGFIHGKKGGESPGASASNAPAQANATDIIEQELDQSTAYNLFRKTGRFTPPARSIPRFRKYNIEDFQFIKVLGKGSFGKVLLAELRDTEYYYAVKCLKKDVVLEDDDVECTLIERKVLALGTNHPYLCHLFATFQTDSHLFFVMEYLNGGDLMFHIQQSGRFPEARGRFYAAEIVSGLKFLHKRGIVYRDLKLDNILLDFDGHVRIADFGMCKLQIYLDKTADTFCGTPDYMAPEIIKGLKYNQTVDWWSFGVLLYEMLIGQSPFSGCDEDELFWSICNEMPSYPRFLSQEALTILTRLLDKDARTRMGGTECMHGDIRDQDFFRPIHWDRLERRELEVPFKPRVRHPLDTQYFDRAFTGERPRLTAVEPQVLRSMDQTPFRGFSYTNPNATDR